jgi:phosphate-selective porin OprO/OprP
LNRRDVAFAGALLLWLAVAPRIVSASEPADTAYDRIWDHAVLFRGDEDARVRRVALSGRLQHDIYWVDADQGSSDDQLWRRFRFGFKANLARDWVVHLEGDFDLNASSGNWYSRLTDAYVGWQPRPDIEVKVLKQSAGFTLDGATSSKSLLTMQRNNLTNNLWFPVEYFTGISVTGEMDKGWSYSAGLFATDGDDELASLEASYFALGSLGYTWASPRGVESAGLKLDVVHNDAHPDSATRDFTNIVSLSSKLALGRWGLWTDLAAGEGHFDQSDVWGISVMPFYDVNELLQFVFRYTHLESRGRNGVRLERYESRVVDGRGDDYDDLYAGVNLFFYGHRLKWQTGLQYAWMRDSADDGGEYQGWGVSTGLRLFW